MRQWLLVEWDGHVWLVRAASLWTMQRPSSLWDLWLWLKDRSSPSMEAKERWWWERFQQCFGGICRTISDLCLLNVSDVQGCSRMFNDVIWCSMMSNATLTLMFCFSLSSVLSNLPHIWGATTAFRILRNHHAVGWWSPWHESRELSRSFHSSWCTSSCKASSQIWCDHHVTLMLIDVLICFFVSACFSDMAS